MFEKKANELMKKAQMIQVYGDIYNTIMDKMNWDCREYHEKDSEHDSYWFTDKPDDEMSDWQIVKRDAYQVVLDAIEKLAK